MLIETKDLRILTDPGAYSVSQNEVKGLDIVLITHEHPDHLHVESLKIVLANNPNAKVVTNSGVGKKLEEIGVEFELLEGRHFKEINGVSLEAYDCKHEEIYEDYGQVQNTGYFIDGRLFYPGDSFYNPEKPVEILALPVAGPWCTIAEAVDYAISVKPKKAFPVHDGMLYKDRRSITRALPAKLLTEKGIEFVDMNEGDCKEF